MLKHRNSQKRIYLKDAVYFVTCKTKGNVPYFKERIFCEVFLENLKICKSLKQFKLFAWVLLHDHFHLLLQPNDGWNISKIIQSFKRNISHNVNYTIGDIEGANNYSRLRFRPMLNQFHQQFLQKYPNPIYIPFPKFQWQKSYHDHYIRDDRDFEHHYNYISYNPQKHGLPHDWPYVFTNPEYADLIDDI